MTHKDHCPRNPHNIVRYDYPQDAQCKCHLTQAEYHDEVDLFVFTLVDDLIPHPPR